MNMNSLVLWVFIAKVLIPGNTMTFKNVVSYELHVTAQTYTLVLAGGKTVEVPAMFTVIEEQ